MKLHSKFGTPTALFTFVIRLSMRPRCAKVAPKTPLPSHHQGRKHTPLCHGFWSRLVARSFSCRKAPSTSFDFTLSLLPKTENARVRSCVNVFKITAPHGHVLRLATGGETKDAAKVLAHRIPGFSGRLASAMNSLLSTDTRIAAVRSSFLCFQRDQAIKLRLK